MARETLATYSDSGATTNASEFAPADTVYLDGGITSERATTGTVVKLEIFDEATDTLQATPLNTTKSFAANTVTTLYSINSDVRVSWATISNTAVGEYYAKLTVGSEVLYIGFKLSGAPSSILYTTTEDFDSGTHDGTMAESDNLYAGIYEDFTDNSLADVFTQVYNAGTQPISGGKLNIAIHYNTVLYSYLYHKSSHTWAGIRKVSAHYIYGQGTSQINTRPCFYIVSKASAPNGLDVGTYVVRCMNTSRGAPFSDSVNALSLRKTSGLTDVISTGGFPIYVSNIIWEILSDGTTLTFNLRNGDTGSVITTASALISDIWTDGNPLWVVFGEVALSLTASIDDMSIIDAASNWTSPTITPPTDKKLKNLTFTMTNGEEGINEIDKVEILDASDDSVIDTATGDIFATGTIAFDAFEHRLDPTFNTSFKIKVYFASGGTDVLTISEISGTYENLARIRTDGQVFI
jgi:hypothetical protein